MHPALRRAVMAPTNLGLSRRVKVRNKDALPLRRSRIDAENGEAVGVPGGTPNKTPHRIPAGRFCYLISFQQLVKLPRRDSNPRPAD